MLLTTEVVTEVEMAATILRWYSDRWRVQEFHKLLKSGCQVERYRLAAEGMKASQRFFECDCCSTLTIDLPASHPAYYSS